MNHHEQERTAARLGRFIPLAGVASVVLTVAGFLAIGPFPGGDTSISKLTGFYSAHQGRVSAGGMLLAWSTIIFAFFGVAVWARIRRKGLHPLVAGAAALVATLTFAAPAAFATETETVHFSGSNTTADVNPCTGATGMLTFDAQGVSHITTLDNGTSHEITTVTGRFTFVPDDASQPTYSGHATFWDGENVNSKTFTATFTGNIVLRGSDGSRLKDHALFHITVNANGAVTSSIDTETLTCP